MLTAHLPAGYVAAKLLFPRLATQGAPFRPFLIAALLGAVAPDFDLLYFYLIDERQHLHHTFWPHFPILWLILLLVSTAWLYFVRARQYAALAVIFTANGMIHMVLDTVVGNIWWFAPFVNQPYSLFTVTARYSPWWLNYIIHWTYGFELAIIVWAIYLWRRDAVRTVKNFVDGVQNEE